MNAFLTYLKARADKGANKDGIKDLLISLGWKYLNRGAFKEVYGKKGVPYVIKLGECTARDERRLLALPEKERLAVIAIHELRDGYAFMVQERAAKTIQANTPPKLINKVFRIIRNKSAAINFDCSMQNMGMSKYGRWVILDA
jgi:hypothetical protein